MPCETRKEDGKGEEVPLQEEFGLQTQEAGPGARGAALAQVDWNSEAMVVTMTAVKGVPENGVNKRPCCIDQLPRGGDAR